MKAGVSPVVATVLLIAIAVIASVGVWFWVSSYTAKPPLVETTFKAFTVVNAYKNSSNNGCKAIDINNNGGTQITNAMVYVRDYTTGKAAGINGTSPSFSAYLNITSLAPGSTSSFRILGGVPNNFTETNISDEPNDVYSVAIGDANNDGQNEVVIGLLNATGTANELRMYKNTSGTWVETNISDENAHVYSVAIGDANNDGQNEVVIGRQSAINELRMYKNTSGTWVETIISDEDSNVRSVAIGDANNDGSNEVVIGEVNADPELRMYNYTGGSWVKTNIKDYGDFVLSVAIGDANNDGSNEVVVGTGISSNELRMYKNTSGTWVETNISDEPGWVNFVVIGDANNDRSNEVVVGLYSSVNSTRMYENKSGVWIETNISNIGTSIAYSGVIGDANNDGSNEIVVGGTFNSELRMYNYTGGSWVETNISNTDEWVHAVAMGDANNDGSNEVVSAFYEITNELRMYAGTSGFTSVPLGTYFLKVSTPGVSDQTFTCV